MNQAVDGLRQVRGGPTNGEDVTGQAPSKKAAPVGGRWTAAGKEQDGRTAALGYVAVARGERHEKMEETEKQEADFRCLLRDGS